MMWGVFSCPDRGEVHVVPVVDDGETVDDILDDHALVRGCWCAPRTEQGIGLLVIHSAFEN